MPSIRLLHHHDVPGAMRLSTEAGWNQTPADWTRVLDLSPDWCYGLECDNILAATSVAVSYEGLAWIGMVLTLEAYRGRGFARALLERMLDTGAFERSRLDATDFGRPLYLKLGYVDEYPVERWHREASAKPPAGRLPAFTDDLMPLDREAFGYDRSALLRRLVAESATCATEDGFAMSRPGRVCRFLGPVVAKSPAGARRLLQAHLSGHADEPAYWDLCPLHHDAVALARESGFKPLRHLMRMRRGPADHCARPNPMMYGMAGFEFG